jgi:hypothetical protein
MDNEPGPHESKTETSHAEESCRWSDSGGGAHYRSAAPIAKVREAAIDAHLPLIEEAGRRGIQILGLQEVFNGPYFCPSQDPHWYDIAEPVPGPTTERIATYAKKYRMAMVVRPSLSRGCTSSRPERS